MPVSIPTPIALGTPSEQYPFHWSIYRWIKGTTLSTYRKIPGLSEDLARFLQAMQRIDCKNAPEPGPENFYRGASLHTYKDDFMKCIDKLSGSMDTRPIIAVWEKAYATSWEYPPVFIHGDMSLGNLLFENNSLKAVIDFGQLACGDPACDYVICWTYFKKKERTVFKDVLDIDEGTWRRSKALALWKALLSLAKFINPDNYESKNALSIIKTILDSEKHL